MHDNRGIILYLALFIVAFLLVGYLMYHRGLMKGKEIGVIKGRDEGILIGLEEGEEIGYADGYRKAIEDATFESNDNIYAEIYMNEFENVPTQDFWFKCFFNSEEEGIRKFNHSEFYSMRDYIYSSSFPIVDFYDNPVITYGETNVFVDILLNRFSHCDIFKSIGTEPFFYAKNNDGKESSMIDIAALKDLTNLDYLSNKGRSDENGYESNLRRFNYYNPKLVTWAYTYLIPSPREQTKDGLFYQNIYDQSFREMTRGFLYSYNYLEENEQYKHWENLYYNDVNNREIHGASWLAQHFEYVSFDPEYDRTIADYDPTKVNEVKLYLYIGFWLRRGIDGSKEECWRGMDKVLRLYDTDWYRKNSSVLPEM